MLFTCELDIPDNYSKQDKIDLFNHIGDEVSEGEEGEEIITPDGIVVGSWEVI
jgi:hypothetical protein